MSGFDDAVRNGLAQAAQHPASQFLSQRGPSIAMVILAALIAWSLAGLVWSLFPSRPDSPIAGALNTQTSSTGPISRSTTDVSPTINAHLFGVATEEPEETVAVELDTSQIRDTDEPLTLRGTLAADSETDAIAIIAEGREENVFRLKETIKRGVTLHAVQKTQVILNVNGSLEALRLPEESSPAARAPARTARQTRRAANMPSVSQVLPQNATSFTQIISPRPYYVGGQQRGYRVYPGKDRRQFTKLGLRPGDIVTEINGTPLTNPTQGAQIFNSLGDAQSVSVTLERNGKPQTLTLDVNQLDLSTQSN